MASPQKNLGDSSLQHPKESFNSPSTISIGSLTQIIIDRLPRIPKNPSQCQKEILKHLKKSQRISKNPKESQRIPKISKNPQESFPQSEGDPEASQKIPKNPQESQRISKNPTQSQKEILKHPKESQRIPKNPKESQRILNNSIELLRILENLGESWRILENGPEGRKWSCGKSGSGNDLDGITQSHWRIHWGKKEPAKMLQMLQMLQMLDLDTHKRMWKPETWASFQSAASRWRCNLQGGSGFLLVLLAPFCGSLDPWCWR